MTDILSDQPTTLDVLGRDKYAVALGRVVSEADTPLVVGLFGDWGSGKTSLMRMIAEDVGGEFIRCVWYDAWQHQDDESPAAALAHTMVDQLQLGSEGRKMLSAIATAFGSALLKATISIDADDVTKMTERYEEARFQVRDARVRLREHLRALVASARGSQQHRLLVFIDDLDRCTASAALAVLESLKLYLNLEGCVFVIGADRSALERAAAIRYGDHINASARYLDKLVQLPFVIPPIHSDFIRGFVEEVIAEDVSEATDLLVAGLGGNPRSIKRFVNILHLQHAVAAQTEIKGYDVRVLALLFLLQYHDPERFALVAADPAQLGGFISARADEPHPKLRAVFNIAPTLPSNLSEYIYLAEAIPADDLSDESSAFVRPLQPDAALAEIVGSDPLPRTEVVKRLWSYIKKHGLQDAKDRKMIHADAALKVVFNGQEQVSMFEMTRLVSRRLT